MYYKARYYDAAVGRFVSVDPLYVNNPHNGIEDPQELNFYAYVNNNPLIYIDPSGQTIILAHPGQRKYFEKLINVYTQGTFEFNEKGELVRTEAKEPTEKKEAKDSEKGSEYYREQLMEAIKSEKIIRLSQSATYIHPQTGEVYDVKEEYGGGLTATVLDLIDPAGTPKQIIDVTISGDYNIVKDKEGKELRMEPKDILMHEL